MGGKCEQHSKETFLRADGKPNHKSKWRSWHPLQRWTRSELHQPTLAQVFMQWTETNTKCQVTKSHPTSFRWCFHSTVQFCLSGPMILDSCLPSKNVETSCERRLLHALGAVNLSQRLTGIWGFSFLLAVLFPPLVV